MKEAVSSRGVAGNRSIVQAVKPFVPARVRRRLRQIQSLDWLPYTDWGDYLWAANRFRAVHGRYPRRDSSLYNDVLFRLRVDELTLPERIRITDKEDAKEFIRERVGDRYSIPIIAVLRSAEEAGDFAYPTECVIKPTHMSGERIFNRPGHAIDRARIAGWFKSNYYRTSREANYRTLTPKVIVEPYALAKTFPGIATHYKINCIRGEPRLVRVNAYEGDDEVFGSTFDPTWQFCPFGIGHPPDGDMPRPANLDEMLDVASSLSMGFSWLRVDLYSDGKQLAIGELTNCSSGALTRIYGEEVASRMLWPDQWAG